MVAAEGTAYENGDCHYLTLRDVRDVLENHPCKFDPGAIDQALARLESGQRVYTDCVYFDEVAPGLYAGYLWEAELT
jgi:hypothetical protein